jgi:hypothetical protein
MKRRITAIALLIGSFVGVTPSSAAITIGGITFDDNAFADTLISSAGSFTTSGGSLASVLTDINEATFAYSFTPGAYVQLGFTNNTLVNGPGPDLSLFELGDIADSFRVSLTVAGPSLNYLSAPTGSFVTIGGIDYELNVANIDLDDFGVPSGAALSSVVVGLDILSGHVGGDTVPTLSLVAARNSGGVGVPDSGSTLCLLAASIFGLAGISRMRAPKTV